MSGTLFIERGSVAFDPYVPGASLQYFIILEACRVLESVELSCPFYRWKEAQRRAEAYSSLIGVGRQAELKLKGPETKSSSCCPYPKGQRTQRLPGATFLPESLMREKNV